jgi:hypothetical protein
MSHQVFSEFTNISHHKRRLSRVISTERKLGDKGNQYIRGTFQVVECTRFICVMIAVSLLTSNLSTTRKTFFNTKFAREFWLRVFTLKISEMSKMKNALFPNSALQTSRLAYPSKLIVTAYNPTRIGTSNAAQLTFFLKIAAQQTYLRQIVFIDSFARNEIRGSRRYESSV